MQTENIQIDREDVVLLILEANERLFRRQAFSGITRLEKLLFLLERETDFEGVATFFVFEPHNFGPFSKEVYGAIEFLSSCELIEVKEKAYSSPYAIADEATLNSEISEGDDSGEGTLQRTRVTEKQFLLTENGRKVAKIIREAIQRRRPADIEQLDSLVQRYGTMSLNRLIRYVYRQHPDMVVNSIHPEAQNIC